MRCFLLTVLSMFALTSCDRSAFQQLLMTGMDHTGEPSLSVAADGTVFLTYLREFDGLAELNLRELLESGWSEPKIVTRGDNLLVNWADFPSVIKSHGDILIAQWMVRQSGPGFAYDVYVASSTDRGDTWSLPERLHSDRSATEHGFVSLYSDDRGAGAFWLDGRRYSTEDADDKGMELRHRKLFGDEGGVEEVVDRLVCDCCQTDVVANSGSPIVVYRDRSEEEIRDIKIARLSDGEWAKTSVGYDGWEITGCPVSGPAIDQEGSVIAVGWFSAVPTNKVRIAFSFDGGASFDSPLDVMTGNPIGRVDIELTASGKAYVSWLAKGRGEFLYRVVSPDGAMSVPTKVVAMATHRNAGFPRMVSTADRLIFAWTDTSGDVAVVRSVTRELP
jgi:hypothetical protein